MQVEWAQLSVPHQNLTECSVNAFSAEFQLLTLACLKGNCNECKKFNPESRARFCVALKKNKATFENAAGA